MTHLRPIDPQADTYDASWDDHADDCDGSCHGCQSIDDETAAADYADQEDE